MSEVVRNIAAEVVSKSIESTPWALIILIFFGAALVAYGLTEGFKKAMKARVRLKDGVSAKEASKRLWWTPLLVIVAMFVGFGVGAGVASFEWKWYYGGLVGSGGGVLASFAVSLLKGNMTALFKKLSGSKGDSKEEV